MVILSSSSFVSSCIITVYTVVCMRLCPVLGIWAVFDHGAFWECYRRPLLCIHQVSHIICWQTCCIFMLLLCRVRSVIMYYLYYFLNVLRKYQAAGWILISEIPFSSFYDLHMSW